MKSNQNLIFVIVILFLTENVQLWEYSEKEQWPEMYKGCAGKRQSPINLSIESARPVNKGLVLYYNKYIDLSLIELLNNGHTVQLTVEIDHDEVFRTAIIFDSGLYYFHSLHFHWGSTDEIGSEHRIDGAQFSMEMHIVHVNDKYPSFEEALKYRDGLAVFGIFFNISTDKSPLTPIVEHLSEVIVSGSSTQLTTSFEMFDLIEGLDTRTFFSYEGSLTTPNCSESVTWIVFNNPLPISENELMEFRQLLDTDNNPLVDNFRNPQPIGSRQVGITK